MKKVLTALGLSMMMIPSAFAADLRILEELMETIFSIGSFVWVTDVLSATKFAIFVVLLAVIYGVLETGFVKDKGVLKNKKVSIVIAFAVSALTVIFIPNDAALAIGETYSAIAAIVLVGLPVGALIWFAYSKKNGLPKLLGGDESTNVPQEKLWILHGIRVLIALAAFAIVAGVAEEYGFVSAIILPLFWRVRK